MKLSARSAAWLLPLLLAGCPHKTQVAQNPPLAPAIEDTPPPKPQPAPTNLPPPEITVPVQPAPPVTTVAPPPAPPKKTPKHKKPATPSTSSTTQQATTGAAEVPAIGQLTSGDPPDLRLQTDSSIASTERGLNGLNRTMSDQDSKTATQIREFLKQARAALTSGDVDGAHTLAIKARVLLDELNSK
jgi:outer membrane biosynthesis protein TonB